MDIVQTQIEALIVDGIVKVPWNVSTFDIAAILVGLSALFGYMNSPLFKIAAYDWARGGSHGRINLCGNHSG